MPLDDFTQYSHNPKLAKAISIALKKKQGLKPSNLPLITKHVPKPAIASEFAECVMLVDYLQELKNKGLVKMFTHIPNETFTTSWKAKRKNTSMGVTSGFPDYVIVTNTQTLFIEMKRSKGGVTSSTQKEWLKALNDTGLTAVVCKGYQEAEDFLNIKLGIDKG